MIKILTALAIGTIVLLGVIAWGMLTRLAIIIANKIAGDDIGCIVMIASTLLLFTSIIAYIIL